VTTYSVSLSVRGTGGKVERNTLPSDARAGTAARAAAASTEGVAGVREEEEEEAAAEVAPVEEEGAVTGRREGRRDDEGGQGQRKYYPEGKETDQQLSPSLTPSLPPYLISRLPHWYCPPLRAFDGPKEEVADPPPLAETKGRGRERGKGRERERGCSD